MQTDEGPRDLGARIEQLLDEALAEGMRDEFDAPTPRARSKALDILGAIESRGIDITAVEVSIGVDGVIEMTRLVGTVWAIAHIEPPGDSLTLTTVDISTKEILSSVRGAKTTDVVRTFERAA